MSIAEIEKMTASEKLRTMEALWDALCHNDAEPESPEWHQDILEKRRRKIESGEARFLSVDEARELVRSATDEHNWDATVHE